MHELRLKVMIYWFKIKKKTFLVSVRKKKLLNDFYIK